jgi:uncharacterized membrane protein HdeD (DUF308 family)
MAPSTVPQQQMWWAMAIAGVVSILFGLIALFWPGLTLMVLVWLFGIYVIVFGIMMLVGMFRAMGMHRAWWPSLIVGLLSIAAGIAVLAWPGITAVTLLYIIAFWAILIGLFEIIGGLFDAHFLLMLVGVISVVFGFVLLANPASGALALVMVIGIFAIIRGIMLLVDAVRMPSTMSPSW